MVRGWIMLVLLLGLIGVAAAIFTVAFELYARRRSQAKYDALHRGMGLDPDGPDFVSEEDR